MKFIPGLIMFGGFLFLIYLTGRDRPLVKMKCKECGQRNKEWSIVPIGHDDFSWQHNCNKEAP